jgi:hypothetical protein
MTHEQLQEEYDRISGIACEVADILALITKVLQEPLEEDETRGLISVVNNYRSLIDGAVPPHEKNQR